MSEIKRIAKGYGFTLLEILVALVIFTILSMMLIGALHNVIMIHSRTESHAEMLRELQRGLLVMSRDIEQVVNRPVLSEYGTEEGPFVGSPQSFMFTHTGFANPTGAAQQSVLQRAGYEASDQKIMRVTYSALDQAPKSTVHKRVVLANAADVRFEYLDKDGRFHTNWPVKELRDQLLPRAVRVYLTIPNWGKMSQLYVIPSQSVY